MPPAAATNGNVWTTLPSLPAPQAALASAAAPCPPGQSGTCVYALGGVGATPGAVGTVMSYNRLTNAWSMLPSLPTSRSALTAASAPCPSGQAGTCVYAIGGYNGSVLATVESYNPTTNAWSPVASMTTSRMDLSSAAAPCPRGQTGTCVYAVGGSVSGGVTASVESFNPVTNAWTTLPSMPTPRSGLAAATAACPPGETGTCVYAVGDFGAGGAAVGTLEALDPPATLD